MKARRVTGMLLVSALAVSLFTGCSGGESITFYRMQWR